MLFQPRGVVFPFQPPMPKVGSTHISACLHPPPPPSTHATRIAHFFESALFPCSTPICIPSPIGSLVRPPGGGANSPHGVALAHLLSPTEVHCVPEAAYQDAQARAWRLTPHSLWEQPVRWLSRERYLEPNRGHTVRRADGSGPSPPQELGDGGCLSHPSRAVGSCSCSASNTHNVPHAA